MPRILALVPALLFATGAAGQTPLEHCSDQLPGSDAANAPKLTSRNDAVTPLCYRHDGTNFFALGYRVSALAPV